MGYSTVTNDNMSPFEKSGVGIENWCCNLCSRQGFIYEDLETNRFECLNCENEPDYIYHENMVINNGGRP